LGFGLARTVEMPVGTGVVARGAVAGFGLGAGVGTTIACGEVLIGAPGTSAGVVSAAAASAGPSSAGRAGTIAVSEEVVAAAAEVAAPPAITGAVSAVVKERNQRVERTPSASPTVAKKPKATHAPDRAHRGSS
jgi:hypothetical protein